MPLAPLRTWPFNTRNLVSLVLMDPIFLSRGYVWGMSGGVHYCFIDPERHALDVWQKEFFYRRLAWFLVNLAAAALAMWFGGPAAAIATFIAIPTLIYVVRDHYRLSAKEQNAPGVSNGPQMEYPGRGGTTSFVAWSGGTGAVAGFVAGLVAALQLQGGVVLFGITIAGPLLATALVVAGASANAAILAVFIAGLLTTPYGVVRGTGIIDPGMGYGGTYYISRTGRGISTYRIGTPTPAAGASVACGGLVGTIVNRTIIYSPPGWKYVAWGLIPLTAQGQPYQPPPGSESFVYDPVRDDPEHWVKGLILVVGSDTFSAAETAAMVMHGVTDAVGMDGFASPVLGSAGELVIDCDWTMDCVQKYGLKMV